MPNHFSIIFLLSELDPTFSVAFRKRLFDIHTYVKMWSASCTMVRNLPGAWMSPSKCPFSFLTQLLPSCLIWTFKWKRMSSMRESIVCWSLHCLFKAFSLSAAFFPLCLQVWLFSTATLVIENRQHIWQTSSSTGANIRGCQGSCVNRHIKGTTARFKGGPLKGEAGVSPCCTHLRCWFTFKRNN